MKTKVNVDDLSIKYISGNFENKKLGTEYGKSK